MTKSEKMIMAVDYAKSYYCHFEHDGNCKDGCPMEMDGTCALDEAVKVIKSYGEMLLNGGIGDERHEN